MPSSAWDQESFWEEVKPMLRAATRGWPNVDDRAPIGEIWLKLTKCYPQGFPQQEPERSKLNNRIRSIARKHHRAEALSRPNLSGKPLVSIDSVGELRANTKPPESEVIARDAAAAFLSKLNPKEREIIASKFGVDRRERSSEEIAKDHHVSRQAVLKRIRKSTDKIRRQTRLD